jgi:hypothetical protein
MFLRCRVSTTGGSAAATYAGASTAVGFKGPGPVGANYLPALSNGYSWIQRLTLYGTGSAVVNHFGDQMLMANHQQVECF